MLIYRLDVLKYIDVSYLVKIYMFAPSLEFVQS